MSMDDNVDDTAYLRTLVLNEAGKGVSRLEFTKRLGEINYNLQDPSGDMYDAAFVELLTVHHPDWLIAEEERDMTRYARGKYSRFETKDLGALEAELMAVYDEHYRPYTGPGYDGQTFEEVVAMFAEDDFFQCHYVARTYLEMLAADSDPATAPLAL